MNSPKPPLSSASSAPGFGTRPGPGSVTCTHMKPSFGVMTMRMSSPGAPPCRMAFETTSVTTNSKALNCFPSRKSAAKSHASRRAVGTDAGSESRWWTWAAVPSFVVTLGGTLPPGRSGSYGFGRAVERDAFGLVGDICSLLLSELRHRDGTRRARGARSERPIQATFVLDNRQYGGDQNRVVLPPALRRPWAFCRMDVADRRRHRARERGTRERQRYAGGEQRSSA